MINLATRVFLVAAAVALVAAVGYGVVVGDRAGADLLVMLAGSLAIVSAVTALALKPDAAPPLAADAPAPERRNAYTEVDAPVGSAWPFVAALAAAALVLAMAAGASWIAAALGTAVIAAVGWLAETWRAHPTFTPRVRERVAERLVAPVAMPVLATLGALFIAAMLSRVLLAVSTTASWVTALIVAAGLLAVLWFISSRPRVRPSALAGTAVVGLLAITGAGIVGAQAGEREFHEHEAEHPVAHVDAENTEFDTDRLEFPAKTDVEIKFRNLDAGVYHNIAFYTSTEPNAKPLYAGKPVPHGNIDYKTRTPDAGTYAFVCDFHPTMTGELVITEGGDHSEHSGEEEH